MVVVKSKLKNIAYRPEEQQTDMTPVYESCQKSKMGYVLTCHSLGMHFCLFSLLFKGIFQTAGYFFENSIFQNFVKTSISLKFKMAYCFSATVMIQITFAMIIEYFRYNHFFPKTCNFTIWPQKICKKVDSQVL